MRGGSIHRRFGILAAAVVLLTAGRPLAAQSFTINIIPDAGLAANQSALDAFNRAAQEWATRINDPITININASLASLPTNVIGSTSSVLLQGDNYSEIVNQWKADSIGKPGKTIIAALPTQAQFTATLPAGRSLATPVNITATKANLKAMGFTGLDTTFGASDGTITFSSNFAFAYDRTQLNGANIDFQTVAAHEIGHLLGFISTVDGINSGATSVQPTPLDLFRFDRSGANHPVTLAEFTTDPRNLIPGADTVTTDLADEYRMSSGLNTTEFPAAAGTDGRQASHWKDGDLVAPRIGIMDPTLGFGEIWNISDADLRAMELIGYDLVPVPEPAMCLLSSFAAFAAASALRRTAAFLPGRA